jgi:hypothetical protein
LLLNQTVNYDEQTEMDFEGKTEQWKRFYEEERRRIEMELLRSTVVSTAASSSSNTVDILDNIVRPTISIPVKHVSFAKAADPTPKENINPVNMNSKIVIRQTFAEKIEEDIGFSWASETLIRNPTIKTLTISQKQLLLRMLMKMRGRG